MPCTSAQSQRQRRHVGEAPLPEHRRDANLVQPRAVDQRRLPPLVCVRAAQEAQELLVAPDAALHLEREPREVRPAPVIVEELDPHPVRHREARDVCEVAAAEHRRHLLGKQGRDALHERFDGAREAQVRVDAAHLGGEVDKLELAIARGDSPLVHRVEVEVQREEARQRDGHPALEVVHVAEPRAELLLDSEVELEVDRDGGDHDLEAVRRARVPNAGEHVLLLPPLEVVPADAEPHAVLLPNLDERHVLHAHPISSRVLHQKLRAAQPEQWQHAREARALRQRGERRPSHCRRTPAKPLVEEGLPDRERRTVAPHRHVPLGWSSLGKRHRLALPGRQVLCRLGLSCGNRLRQIELPGRWGRPSAHRRQSARQQH
mmetsp:Transcript_34815/g.103787  ORF Transcript_34815/g.103787 Transcript_34815/m.103787 type:complete len:376 (+) Transcript_34815:199-1326(+)